MSSLMSSRCLLISFVLCIVSSGYCAARKHGAKKNTTRILPADDAVGTYSVANEMCREYSQLIYNTIRDPVLISGPEKYIKIKDCFNALTLIVNGVKANPKEFPHMALLGYNEDPDSNEWSCGGSLISNSWILSAAHCEKLDAKSYVLWARLGDLNYLSDTDYARPMDYKIIQRVVHPDYRSPSLYNDIALFRLEKDVKFSAYVRPICLNADPYLQPSAAPKSVIATGWGKTDHRGPVSPDLMKVTLNVIPFHQCNNSYSWMIGSYQLSNGLDADSMICAGYLQGGKDTCGGDSGGPIQIKHSKYECMYTQIGITSFGDECAKKNSPGVYTRVSKYLPWIERIVWPATKA